MADESNVLPPSRIVRWMLLGGVILFAVALYFRSGLHLPPVGAASPAAETQAPPAQPPQSPTR